MSRNPPEKSLPMAELAQVDRTRNQNGWRAGKPIEDPEKVKRWGLVSAKPSEFLIHVRRGEVRRTSGQGASCFKWPHDAVAIIPTTVQRLHFTADQVTTEKVGVQITGLAVYRIADPLLAYRMLNFSFPERASEKLEQLLVEMFVGASRRLVANLTIEECLTRRKEGIAAELMREIAPVVSGKGRAEDHTDRGWGVVIDTIEIQDVRVLSSAVFADMQARFRKDLERQARESQAEQDGRAQATEAEAARRVALVKLEGEAQVRERRMAEEERARQAKLAMEARLDAEEAAQKRAQALAELEAQSELQQRRMAEEERARQGKLAMQARLSAEEAAQKRAEALAALEAQAELQRRQAEEAERAKLSELTTSAHLAQMEEATRREREEAAHAAAMERLARAQEEAQARHREALAEAQRRVEVERIRVAAAEAQRQRAEAELALFDLEQHKAERLQAQELERARIERELENFISNETIQLAVAQSLPQLALAFQQKLGTVNVTAVDGANPFGFVAAAVEGVMSLARSAGLELPKPKREVPPEA
jgi:regulator of protease activity HflC (stomatin/prohibitin superfamily)